MLVVIIYCCYGGAHSSPIAAAVHVGKLSKDKQPTKEEIFNVRYYDKVDSQARGKILPVGVDDYGNQVFACGRGGEKRGIEQAIQSGILLAGGSTDQVLFVNTLPAVNLLMRIGGFLSRKLKWVWLGRPIVIIGSQKAFPRLVEIVEETKTKLSSRLEE